MKTEQGIQHLRFKIQNNNKVTYWDKKLERVIVIIILPKKNKK